MSAPHRTARSGALATGIAIVGAGVAAMTATWPSRARTRREDAWRRIVDGLHRSSSKLPPPPLPRLERVIQLAATSNDLAAMDVPDADPATASVEPHDDGRAPSEPFIGSAHRHERDTIRLSPEPPKRSERPSP